MAGESSYSKDIMLLHLRVKCEESRGGEKVRALKTYNMKRTPVTVDLFLPGCISVCLSVCVCV